MKNIFKFLAIFPVIIFLAAPVLAASSGETSGLGALSLELEYSKEFQALSSQTILAKIVHGLSNQVDIKIILGTFGIEKTAGLVYGAGLKWGLLQETHFSPAVSLNMELFRGSYTAANISSSITDNVKIETTFFTPSVLISKNLTWIIPYMEAGINLADVKAKVVSTGNQISGFGGSSSAWFFGAGAVFEFNIINVVLELIYDFDTPLGDNAFKFKGGLNLFL